MRKYTKLLPFLLLLTLFTGLCSACGSSDPITTEMHAAHEVPAESDVAEIPSVDTDIEEISSIDLSGKSFSLLGDSISTFTGTQPSDYNIFYPESGEIKQLEDTWWMQLAAETGMELCRNASSSNTTVRGDSTDRSGNCPGCSTRRAEDLGKAFGVTPDLIFILMGTNDFLRSVDPGTFTAPSARQEGDTVTFAESYELMLQKVLALYPTSEVWCLTVLTPGSPSDPTALRTNECKAEVSVYNDLIRSIGSAYGCRIMDMNACGIVPENLADYTGDGVHPNPAGAKLMADYAYSVLMTSR